MKIGVISDTHIPRKGKELPARVVDAFKGIDLILHAGDINKDYVIYELEELAPVEAVAGNTDDDFMAGMLGRKKVVEAGGVKIGLVHGDGAGGRTLERVKKEFAAEKVDCVVFGHSHIPFNELQEGVLYFNPGSPTDKRRQERFSYGILEIGDGRVKGEIIFF